MTLWFAFLGGINLGKRQIKMDALRDGLAAAGFTDLKTMLASGNVRFCADGSAEAVRQIMEQTIAGQFGFSVGVVLRPEEAFNAMLANQPFDRLDPGADVARHALMLDEPLPQGLALPDRPGHTEILRIDRREIYLAGYRQANGRYTEGVELVLKPLHAAIGKGVTGTMRNWNTIEKMTA